jgi:glycerol-1-phosphate dehydrogenase [NAD(P)+]
MESNKKIMSLDECLNAAEDTKYMLVKEGALADIPGVLKKYFSAENKSPEVFVIADKNTFRVAGETVLAVVKAAGITVAGSYVFTQDGLHAEYVHVEKIMAELQKALASAAANTVLVPVAVGSGTINDLVKRAASEARLPYLCVPTAASVDGYTSYGAALLYEGFKQTMSCEAPLAVVADSVVLAEAPAYLSSSGFADLAGKLIAGSDWIIADSIFALDGKGELAPALSKIDTTAWTMVQHPLRDYLQRSTNAAKGDKNAVGALFEGLGITGFALQYMKDSRSVSGCEHMWSHVWEMENLCVDGVPVTHGHKVAMGTLAATAFTECLFAEKPALQKNVPTRAEREAEIRSVFAGIPDAIPAVLKTALEKLIDDAEHLAKLRSGVLDNWDAMRNAVRDQLLPYAELRALFADALCPIQPATINLSRAKVIADAKKSQMIRKRFTVLDLAFELGVFDTVLARMEAGDYLR